MDAINISTLVNEILAGSSRAVIAMLILIIITLINELRISRNDKKEMLEKIEEQRLSYLSVINEMQQRFSEKSEEMLEKYHNSLISQHESTSKTREVLANFINTYNKNKED